MKNDKYQIRYLKHQDKKKRTLTKLMRDRHSTRIFGSKPIPEKTLKEIMQSISHCPSSCDRQAISLVPYRNRDAKQLLGGFLVGGVGWIHRADTILTIWADKVAYKENIPYMPYLDAGVVIQHLYLVSEALGLKCCYVNPNVRDAHFFYFENEFNKNNKVYCGALAMGYE